MEFDITFRYSRYLHARRMVQMTNKVRIVTIEYKTVRHGYFGIEVIYKPQALSSALTSLMRYSLGLQVYKLLRYHGTRV